MAAATYSIGPQRISGAVSAQTSTNATLYTAPANSYAIINLTLDSGNAATSTQVNVIVGETVSKGAYYFLNVVTSGPIVRSNVAGAANGAAGSGVAGISNGVAATANQIVVAAGHSVFVTITTSGAVTFAPIVNLSGVQFTNS